MSRIIVRSATFQTTLVIYLNNYRKISNVWFQVNLGLSNKIKNNKIQVSKFQFSFFRIYSTISEHFFKKKFDQILSDINTKNVTKTSIAYGKIKWLIWLAMPIPPHSSQAVENNDFFG